MNLKKNQTGSTLIVVLLLIAAMIALAATMTLNIRATMLRTTQLDQSQQAIHYVGSAARLTKVLLQESLRGQPIISSDQPWAIKGMTYPLKNASLQGDLQDMRRCYNVNALSTLSEDEQGKWPDAVEKLVNLMVLLEIPLAQARKLTAAIWDYIDSDQINHHNGAEDVQYLGKTPAYLAANQMISDTSELLVVEGVNKDIYQKLTPYLCALPSSVLQINVNTLTEDHSLLLQAFSKEKLSPASIKKWLKNRPLGGWQSIEQALDASTLSMSPDDKLELAPYLTVNSDYFRFDGKITTDDISYQWMTLWHWKDPEAQVVFQMQL